MTCQEIRKYLNEIKERCKDSKEYCDALTIAESYVNFAELGFKLAVSNGENEVKKE